ncbi:MAG TPA: DUF1499 domain-containing protein [Rhizomicrobium sp.]|jgi:hypothetical protein
MASTAPTLDAEATGLAGGAVRTVLQTCARLSFAALLASIAIALTAGFGTRFGLWNYETGLFGIFPYCIYFGIAALGFGITWIAIAIFAGGGAGAIEALIGVVGAIAVLWVPLNDLFLTDIEHALPPIHDISTDIEHPPQFLTANRPGATNPATYDGPHRVRFDGKLSKTETLQKLYYGEVKAWPQLGPTPAKKLFAKALAAARSMGWTIVAVAPDAEGGFIQASDTTLLFGLTDDIVLRVRPAGIGARLDIRSKSRVGISDFGRNAARILALREKIAAM